MRALGRFWALALVVALTAMAVLVTALALAPRTYTATAVVAMVPRLEARVGADVLRLAIPTYSTLATSQRVAADLAGRFQEDVDVIEAAVTAENPPSSNTVLLTAAWGDPDTAAAIANGLADEVIEAAATDPLLTASLVAVAGPPTQPTWPPQRASLVVGAVVAVVLGVAVAMVADRRRPLVSSPADLVRLVEEDHQAVPVLVTGRVVTGTAEILARTVEDRLAAQGDEGIPQLELAVVDESSARSVALAVGAATALSRRGRRVAVYLGEHERALAQEPDVARELSLATPGRVVVESWPGGVPPHGYAELGEEPGAVDVIVRFVRATEHLRDWTPSKSVLGVVAAVGRETPSHRVRAVLNTLAGRDAPVLAICYLVPSPNETVTTSG